MTILLAWMDHFGGWLFADSAGTHQNPPRHSFTSFGELQTLDSKTVEEIAIKISRLPGDTIAAACGDSWSAQRFLDLTSRELATRGIDHLASILSDLLIVARDWDPFALIFMRTTHDSHQLMWFDNVNGPSMPISSEEAVALLTHQDKYNLYLAGSPSPGLSQQLVYTIASIRKSNLPPILCQMTVLAYLQSLGISEILPAQGIGGAFWSIRLFRGECHWQEDITYIIYNPGMFVPMFEPDPSWPILYQTKSHPDMVRCVIRDGIGFVISSVERKSLSLGPLGSQQSDLSAAHPKVEQPQRYFAPCRYLAFLSRMGRRVVLLDRGEVMEHCQDFAAAYSGDMPPDIFNSLGIDKSDPRRDLYVVLIFSEALKNTLDVPAGDADQCYLTVIHQDGDVRRGSDLHLPHADDTLGIERQHL